MSAPRCRILSVVVSSALILTCPLLVAEASVVRHINPDLDPKSDEKFFGPPFPADYPSDLRGGGKHAFNYPFPHVQGSSTFDSDYVKDENSDNGEWQAQMDYDSLRAQLQKAKREAEEAKDKEQTEANEADKAEDAYKDAQSAEKAAQDAAAKAAEEAKEAADKAKDAGKVAETQADVPLENAIEDAKKKVEDKIKNLDDCKQQLIDAQNELKALLEESQKKRDEEAAIHSEERQEAAAKHTEATQAADSASSGSAKASQALESAEKLTQDLKAKFEEEKGEEEKAEELLKKEQDDVAELEKKLKAAEDRLRAIRNGGHAPAQNSQKSSSRTEKALSLAVLALAAVVLH